MGRSAEGLRWYYSCGGDCELMHVRVGGKKGATVCKVWRKKRRAWHVVCHHLVEMARGVISATYSNMACAFGKTGISIVFDAFLA